MHHTGSKGDIGVARVIADLTERGYDVLLPVSSTSPFDLVAHKDGAFKRVQVKYVTAVNGAIIVASFRKSIWNGKVKKKANEEIDWICAYNPDTSRCYYLRREDTPRTLRITAPRINLTANIHMADKYLSLPST